MGEKNNTEGTEDKRRREWHPSIIYDEMAGVLGLRNDKPIAACVIQKRKQNGLQVFKRLLNCMYQVRIPTYPLPKFLLCTLPVLIHNVHSYVNLPKNKLISQLIKQNQTTTTTKKNPTLITLIKFSKESNQIKSTLPSSRSQLFISKFKDQYSITCV
jgi:hypothetical protein